MRERHTLVKASFQRRIERKLCPSTQDIFWSRKSNVIGERKMKTFFFFIVRIWLRKDKSDILHCSVCGALDLSPEGRWFESQLGWSCFLCSVRQFQMKNRLKDWFGLISTHRNSLGIVLNKYIAETAVSPTQTDRLSLYFVMILCPYEDIGMICNRTTCILAVPAYLVHIEIADYVVEKCIQGIQQFNNLKYKKYLSYKALYLNNQSPYTEN